MINEIFKNSRYFYWFVAVFFFSLLCVGYMAEYGFDIAPCSLCMFERYVMMTIMVMALGVVVSGVDHKIGTSLIYLFALGGAVLCGYHIGVELKWWAMPESCISNISLASNDPVEMAKALQEQMKNQKIARCDQINWYLFGVPASWWTFGAFLFATLVIGWREWTNPKK
jgi:disulfide bond formation protein DsbB